ncbi:MAG: Gfo/Idh/MocA family oxidoreductase [Clostridia bacterium]|nr:Gfo/Idh/MocA family oxidoreductase [Clostridia bacterium]
MADKIRYGIVGIGKQGSRYAGQLFAGMDKNGVLSAVCDIAEDRREWAKSKFGDKVKVFENYEEMFASGLIDAVLIDTPHYAHPVIAQKALEMNIHALSDKPAGVYTKAVREVAEYAKSQRPNLKFGLLYNQRTSKIYKKAKEIIESGQLGNLKRIVWIITNWYRPQAYYSQGGWRGTWAGEGGGVLINQDPHQLDLFTWLAGSKITSVNAIARTVGRQINVENDVTATCTFENGATGVFITSTHEAPGTNRLEISGDGGKIVISGNADFTMKLEFTKLETLEPEFSKTNTVFMGKPKSKTLTVKFLPHEMIKGLLVDKGQHINVIRNFSNVLIGKEDKLIGNYEEGLNGLTFSNAIHLSAWLGRTVSPQEENFEDLYYEELQKKIEKEKTNSVK